MAASTSNYAWPYPTSSDLVRDGATAIGNLASAIDSFIGGSSALSKLFNIAANQLVTTSATTTSVGSFVNLTTGPNTGNFTLGPSGLAVIITQARIANSTTATNFVSTALSGDITAAASVNRAGISTGTNSGTVIFVDIIDGNPNGTVTWNVQGQVSSASTMTVTWSKVTALTLG